MTWLTMWHRAPTTWIITHDTDHGTDLTAYMLPTYGRHIDGCGVFTK